MNVKTNTINLVMESEACSITILFAKTKPKGKLNSLPLRLLEMVKYLLSSEIAPAVNLEARWNSASCWNPAEWCCGGLKKAGARWGGDCGCCCCGCCCSCCCCCAGVGDCCCSCVSCWVLGWELESSLGGEDSWTGGGLGREDEAVFCEGGEDVCSWTGDEGWETGSVWLNVGSYT